MVILSNDTVETWLQDREIFSHDFMEYSFAWHHAVGADIHLVRQEIEAAHDEWVEIVTDWKNNRFRQGATHLSYIKTFAILLSCLSKRTFCGEMKEYVAFRDAAPIFSGSDELKKEVMADLLGAPDIVTALEFCIGVLNFYEQRRIDKKDPFSFRMTESSRHDFIVALSRKQMSPDSVFLALENLYARD